LRGFDQQLVPVLVASQVKQKEEGDSLAYWGGDQSKNWRANSFEDPQNIDIYKDGRRMKDLQLSNQEADETVLRKCANETPNVS
jgi:hypothetical protein